MVSNVSLNAQSLRSDCRNISKLSSPLSFKGHDDDEIDDKVEISKENKTSEAKKEESAKQKKGLEFNRVLKQFGNGFIAPVKAMVDSPTSIAVTAGVGALTGFVLKKAPQVGPLLVIAGASIGAIQTALGIKKAVQEKTVEGKEKGIYEAGQGSFALAASAVTARSFLAEAAPKVGLQAPSKDQGMLKSVYECIKGAPTYLKSSLQSLTNDNVITDMITTAAGKSPVIAEGAGEVAAATDGNSILKASYLKKLAPTAEGNQALSKTDD